MVKAIFLDIDGTLLAQRSHTVLQSTIDDINALQSKGVRVFIASGRPMVLIPPMPVRFDGFVTVNGGHCTLHDKVLLRKPIDNDDTARWLAYADEHNIVSMGITEHEIFINRIDETAITLRNELGFTMPSVRQLATLKDEDVFQFIAIQPEERDADVLSLLTNCRMPRWHRLFSDIIPAGISKAIGIECILNHLGISREETMAFGDGSNDIEMLEFAGIGVAMGNAADNVKQRADFVTLDSDSDGIHHAFKHFNLL